MRRVVSATLLITLAMLHAAGVCLARLPTPNYCSFDRRMKNLGGDLSVLQKVSAVDEDNTDEESDGRGDWNPLRIKMSTKDLEKGGRQCKESDIGKNITGFDGTPYECNENSFVFPTTKERIMEVLTKAIKLHTDRLSVRPSKGPIRLSPFERGACKYFTVPDEYFATGFKDADMVLFVGALSDRGSSTTGWAVPCAVNAEGRPVAGAVNMFTYNLKTNIHGIRSTAHQIAHALGFWRVIMEDKKMTRRHRVRGKNITTTTIVKTDQIKKAVKKHYGCKKRSGGVIGMELEDGRNNNGTQSHWERRNAKDELMANFYFGGGSPVLGLYTELTLAAFEDMGFYKADFSKAEPMTWGKNAGCDFLTKSCYDDDSHKFKFPTMFCGEENVLTCTSDRRATGYCMKRARYQRREHYVSLHPPNVTRFGDLFALTEFCPVVVTLGSSCSKPDIVSFKDINKGSLYGHNSWCVDAEDMKVKENDGSEPLRVKGVCVFVKCEGNRKLKVDYTGAKKWEDCPEGQSIEVSTKREELISGSIKCPKYEEVCTVGDEGESLITGRKETEVGMSEDESDQQELVNNGDREGEDDGKEDRGNGDEEGDSVPEQETINEPELPSSEDDDVQNDAPRGDDGEEGLRQ